MKEPEVAVRTRTVFQWKTCNTNHNYFQFCHLIDQHFD